MLHRVLFFLDDASLCRARAAARCFRTATQREIVAERALPLYLASTQHITRLCLKPRAGRYYRPGRYATIKLLVDLGVCIPWRCMTEAAAQNNLGLVRFMCEQVLGAFHAPWIAARLDDGDTPAAREDAISFRIWLLKSARCFASVNGHVRMVAYLHAQHMAQARQVCVAPFNARRPSKHASQAYPLLWFDGKVWPDTRAWYRIARGFDGEAARAAAAGHGGVLRFLHEHDPSVFNEDVMNKAARHGHLEVVRFLHEHRTEGCTTDAMDKAAKHGHLDVVRFLHEHRTEGCTTDAMDGAATYGHLEVVRFLHEHRTEGCTTNAMDGAAYHGHLGVVRFLYHKQRYSNINAAAARAAANGHTETLRFLWETGANLGAASYMAQGYIPWGTWGVTSIGDELKAAQPVRGCWLPTTRKNAATDYFIAVLQDLCLRLEDLHRGTQRARHALACGLPRHNHGMVSSEYRGYVGPRYYFDEHGHEQRTVTAACRQHSHQRRSRLGVKDMARSNNHRGHGKRNKGAAAKHRKRHR
jgi:hypothetical protein